jgi:hypothetical protein
MALRLSKNAMNMAYGLGASVVIIGALMKIIHQDLGPITGNTMLTIGLVTRGINICYVSILTHQQKIMLGKKFILS